MEYEPVFNNITKITDKLGRVTRFSYDSRGNLIAITDPLNQVTAFAYDQFGQLVSVTDPLGHTRQIEYDTYGNVSAMKDALGNRTTMAHDLIGRLTSVSDPLGRRTSLEYDFLDRVTSVTGPAGATTRFAYDPNGNRTSVTNALGRRWTNEYDEKDRLISQTDPLGRVTRMEYNAEDELEVIISPLGRATRYGYDLRGQIVKITDPLGGTISFTYDNVENLVSLTDQRGNTTAFTYDQLYRPIATRDPLGQVTSASYDPVGNIIERVDRLGRRTSFSYDALNRPARIAYQDGAVVTHTYDAAGRRTRIDDTQSTGRIEWAYDDADRLLSEISPAGMVKYTYNAASQRASMTAADRLPVNYDYDPAGRLKTITQGAEVFTYSYDLLSRRASLQRPNGVTTSYSYDEVNRLVRLLHTGAQGQPIEDFNYSYDADDRIISIASLASASLLPPSRNVSAADANNRIAQFGEAGFGFDAEGQTISKANAQGTTRYEWDARGRLTRAVLSNGQAVSYGYDALGRLASRSAGTTTSFLYDGVDIVLDRGSDGSTVDYLNGMGIDEKLRQTNAGLGRLYFIHDHLGSTATLTGENSGVAEQLRYEAFGESAGSAVTRYGFTGREKDAATGLMYYRARWYDPQQGRFILEDPIEFKGGDLNFYAYVANDPISFGDPQGLFRPFNWTADKLAGFWEWTGLVSYGSWLYRNTRWAENPTLSKASQAYVDAFDFAANTMAREYAETADFILSKSGRFECFRNDLRNAIGIMEEERKAAYYDMTKNISEVMGMSFTDEQLRATAKDALRYTDIITKVVEVASSFRKAARYGNEVNVNYFINAQYGTSRPLLKPSALFVWKSVKMVKSEYGIIETLMGKGGTGLKCGCR
jgi:RHS repeat-associated protein